MSDDQRQQVVKRALLEIRDLRAKLDAAEYAQKEPIAIIGMGCRFPGGADSPEAFWQLLQAGRDVTRPIPPDRWDVDAYYDPNPATPGKMVVQRGGFLDEVDQFDPVFFNIPPREAVSLDPQHRLFLEVSWEALENAGVAPDKLAGSQTGVFVGITTNDYGELLLQSNDLANLDTYVSTGNPSHFAAGRLSYILGLQGPSMALDTACSSSLTAVYLACQSLRTGACDVALAGGVNVILSPETTVMLAKAGMLATDGRCKTFDASADGYSRGEGCGVIVLKRLSAARAAGDNILALIPGAAVNQDGQSSGLTVPNGLAQQRLIRAALADANIAPSAVDYVEAHGTGTSLGDPIEVRALAAVFGQDRPSERPLQIGSAKTNIGHLESAAGIAGLIKLVLALQHEELPPHLHFKQPNPYIAWADLPVAVTTERSAWPAGDRRRIAGVSSFGVSGTNAHIILEGAPAAEPIQAAVERPLQLLAFSAKDERALRELAARYQHQLAESDTALADVCYTANTGRAHFPHRLAVVASSAEQMRDRLAVWAGGEEPAGVRQGQKVGTRQPEIVFLFTGQGAQYVGMGRQLYETQPTFRQALDRCDEILRPYLEQPLLSVLYPAANTASPLDATAYTQPALFAIEYALAQLWQSWGIRPAAVMGHSVGEYVAACLAGVFSLEDGLKLIAARGRLMQNLPQNGKMVTVFADEQQVMAALAPYTNLVSIAALNGPNATVISGESQAVQAVVDSLTATGVKHVALQVSHAFHSPLMEPMLTEFGQVAAQVTFAKPKLKLISNLTGRLIRDEEIANVAYWQQHIRKAVRFADGMETLQRQGYQLFVEIGPQPTLIGMGQRCVPNDKMTWLPSLRKGHNDWSQMLESLGTFYAQGVAVNWSGFDGDYPRRKVTLPTYPFQRQRYWFETAQKTEIVRQPKTQGVAGGHSLLGQRLSSPLKSIQFETQISMDSATVIADHQVYGMVLTPGVVYFEMALAAMEQMFGESKFNVRNLKLLQPLVLDKNDVRTVQLLLTPDDAGKTTLFQIFSLVPGHDTDSAQEPWKLLVEGRFPTEQTAISPVIQRQVSIEEIRARCTEEISAAEFYATFWHPEFHLGAGFRQIAQLWRRHGEVLGQLHPMTAADSERYGVRADFMVLDAAIQPLVAALPRTREDVNRDVFIVTGLESTHIYKSMLDVPLWCQARLRGVDDSYAYGGNAANNGYQNTFVGDFLVFDETGEVIAELTGVRFSRVARETLRRVLGVAPVTDRPLRISLSQEQLVNADPNQRLQLLQTYFRDTVARIMGLPPLKLDMDQPLVSLIDSLMSIELKNHLETDLKVTIPLVTFLDGSSTAQLAASLLDKLIRSILSTQNGVHINRETPVQGNNGSGFTDSTAMTVAELEAEAILDATIVPASIANGHVAEPAAILLTGATGFIGAFLLYDLLRQTQADIYCLVRAANLEEGRHRIQTNLASYSLWEEHLGSRVIPVVGDLTKPLLGLSEQQFQTLAGQIDLIWHCGALVKWTYPYRSLKAANVLGTEEVLRLACQIRTKPVHFVSTVGVFWSPDYTANVVREDEDLHHSGALSVGYAQSKWVAEKLVRIAGERGVPIAIYRPATGGHSQTGIYNAHDHLPMLIKGCIQLGCAPDLDMVVQVAPIDYASKAMVHLAMRKESLGKTFHLVNPHAVEWLELVDMVRKMGYPLRHVSYDEWRTALVNQVRESRDNALYGLSSFFADATAQSTRLPHFDSQNTLDGLEDTAIVCPPLDTELLTTYFTSFTQSGFLAPSPSVLLKTR